MATSVKRAGFSLAETLLGAVLGFLVLAMVVALFYATSRASQRSQASVQLQQIGLISMNRLIRDIQTTSAGALGWAESKASPLRRLLSIQPQSAQLSGPSRTYQQALLAYQWDSRRQTLERRIWEQPNLPVTLDTALATRLSEPQLLALDFSGARKVAPDVVDFNLTSDVAPPNIGNPLVLTLKLRRDLPGKRPVEFQLLERVYLRNSSR